MDKQVKCARGHNYISKRGSHECPICRIQENNIKLTRSVRDLQTNHPDLYGELDTPISEADEFDCTNVYDWKCSICNEHWQASIADRLLGEPCPHCMKKKSNGNTWPDDL